MVSSQCVTSVFQVITRHHVIGKKAHALLESWLTFVKQHPEYWSHRRYCALINRNMKNCCQVSKIRHSGFKSIHEMQNEAEFDDKKVGLTKADQEKLVKMKPQQPHNPRILKVSIIGAPNAGKSTLANQLTGWRFASVSKKVHTTRHSAVGILTQGEAQIVFLDTPGLITAEKVKKHHLEKSLLTDPYSSLFQADLIIAVVDVAQAWNRSKLDHNVLTALMMHDDKRSILVLNKVDLLKCKSDLLTASRLLTDGVIGGEPAPHVINIKKHRKRAETDILKDILEKEGRVLTENEKLLGNVAEATTTQASPCHHEDGLSRDDWWTTYSKKLKEIGRLAADKRGWEKFDRVFMISAVDGDGVDDIKQYLIDTAVPGPWLFHSAVITDQDPLELVRFCVREKILDHLPKEIPYQIEVKVKQWELGDDNYLRAIVDLICPRSRDLVHLIGKDGRNISQIKAEAKQELMNIFQRELSLHLNAYVRTKRGAL